MRHWRKVLASVIVFGPAIVFVAMLFYLWVGKVEFDRTDIEITNAKAEKTMLVPIKVRNTSALRSAKITGYSTNIC